MTMNKRYASAGMLLLALLAAAALTACTVSSDTPSAFQTQAAADLRGMKALLPVLNAGLSMLPDTAPASRALDPSSTKLSALNGKSPSKVYGDYGGTGTNTVSVPNTGFFDDYYNTGNQMYFTIAPDALGAGYYRIRMYVYPRTDLNIRYLYEEYIVNDAYTATWNWEYFDTNLNPGSYVKLETYYADGSKGTRTVAWRSSSADLRYYPAFDVPAVTPTAAAYAYPASIPARTFTTTGNFSVNTGTLVKGSTRTVESTEYYTETSATAHSGISYVTTSVKGRDRETFETVTLFQEDTVGVGSKTVRSLTVLTSSKSGGSYTETNEVVIGDPDADGFLNYTGTMNGWNLAASAVGAALGNTSTLEIERTSTSPVTWTGRLTEYAGNAGTVYDVTLKANADGTYTMTQTPSATATRSLAGAVSVNLKSLGSVSVPLSTAGATFSGSFEMGAFLGTYAYGGTTADVEVSNRGVAVDDWFFRYE